MVSQVLLLQWLSKPASLFGALGRAGEARGYSRLATRCKYQEAVVRQVVVGRALRGLSGF
jgi:hypothetical protein